MEIAFASLGLRTTSTHPKTQPNDGILLQNHVNHAPLYVRMLFTIYRKFSEIPVGM